jgi:hypothetical protein
MKIIPPFFHGIIDYVGAVAFFFAPEIFGFADGPSWAVAIPRIVGVFSVIYSVATDYQLGLIKVLPMRVHLALDYVVALAFLASPFAFGFINGPKHQWLPHLGAAVFVLVVTTLTRQDPSGAAGSRR